MDIRLFSPLDSIGSSYNGNKGLSLQRATLHSAASLEQQKRKQEHITNLLSSMEKLKKSTRVNTRKKPGGKPRPPVRSELDAAEKKQISETLEREKYQQ